MARKSDFVTLEQIIKQSTKAINVARRAVEPKRRIRKGDVIKDVVKLGKQVKKVVKAVNKIGGKTNERKAMAKSAKKRSVISSKTQASKKTVRTAQARTVRTPAKTATIKAKPTRAAFTRSKAQTKRASGKARKGAFTKSVIRDISLSDRIINSKRQSEQMRAEIEKTIALANRQVSELEKAGITSSALKRAQAESGRSYFSLTDIEDDYGGNEWEYLKDEYARAVSFLNTPTSSVRGAKQYIQWYAKRNGIDYDTAERIIDMATSPEIDANGLIKLMDYSSLLKQFGEEIADGNIDYSKMDAREYGRTAERRISRALTRIAKQQNDRGILAEYDLR